MDGKHAGERRTGFDRRSGIERRNGLAVLMGGCSVCGRAAPAPAEMHVEGWLIVADDEGLVEITCPEHREGGPGSTEVPDYLIDQP